MSGADTTRAVTIYGPDQRPVEPAVIRQARHNADGFMAADRRHPDLADWTPYLSSADADVLMGRDLVAARVHDIARNDGWASGALQKHLDSAIGSGLRLSAKPDYRALGLDAEWSADFATAIEGRWRGYANDSGFYCDAARQSNMGGVFARAYRHRLLDGEALARLVWLPGRGGTHATAIEVIDPDRLSNPDNRMDSDTLRGGVEVGRYGEAIAYHVRKAHPGDLFGLGFARDFAWERVQRETAWGRPVMLHDFEADRAGQTRGRSPLAPVLKKLRMLGRYDETELQAALVNAVFAAFIESPFDHEMVGQALQTSDLGQYQDLRAEFHDESRLKLSSGVRIPTLFPGEKFNFQAAQRPNTAFAAFEEACLRNIASALGLSYEQLAMDWSKTNYSSARAALVEVWKFITARRGFFCTNFANLVYAAWLEEELDSGEIETPPGAPEFLEARAAYSRCEWIGPPRGWVDPVKEAQAAVVRMQAGLSTLERECAEQGLDYEEVLTQRKREEDMMKKLGLAAPSWAQIGAVAAPSDQPAPAGAPS